MINLEFVLTAEQPGSYDHIIENDDVDAAYSKLKSIVIDVSTSTANQCRNLCSATNLFHIL